MNTMRLLFMPVLALALWGMAQASWSDSVYVSAKVQRVLVVSDSLYGGCMAMLSVDPASVLPACSPNWVTFSCTGDFTDPIRAYRMLDQAQLALSSDKPVLLQITDAQRHNNYCFAPRIDVLR
jgi:hypothetical protein